MTTKIEGSAIAIDARVKNPGSSECKTRWKMANRISYAAVGRCAALAAIGAAMAIASSAQTFSAIKKFNGTDGRGPAYTLVEGLDGNLYGTTQYGGPSDSGTVFKLNSSGHLTTLYSFCSLCPSGQGPAPLVLGNDGQLYGTTFAGGNINDAGTVFKMTTKGKLTTLYTFCVDGLYCLDGSGPGSALVQGTDGNFYGTTAYGGSILNAGTVFRISPNGTISKLYFFCADVSCNDGLNPSGALIQGTDGNFYGTTARGGANGFGGTVFRISPTGTLTTLYSFCALPNCADGDFPSGVVEGADGNFYGTTSSGGDNSACSSGCGTVFQLTPQGTFTTLYEFTPPGFTGNQPNGLIKGTDGNFYGTTSLGGADNYGTIFQVSSGAFTRLHSFTTSGGDQPLGGLVQKTDGNFYGTAQYGGNLVACSTGCGTVFRESMNLSPFVKTIPIAACAGCGVDIEGPNLTGTTNVTFNGLPARFVVVSPTLINATVPSGATTGPVQVTAPGGVLTSNVPFQVLP